MRYGVGAAVARPGRSVARTLGLSSGEYTTVRRRALRGLVRDARTGSCGDGAATSTTPAIAFGDGGELRTVAGGSRGASEAPDRAEIAVRGERASGGSEPSDEDGSGFSTPLAVDADEPDGSMLGALMLAGALGLLAVVGVRTLRARVRH
jgi:hypothetical protein